MAIEKNKNHKFSRIINIFTAIVLTALILVLTDILLVTYCDIGPFLAIPLHKYDDGGTKEYYGLGYKVIKYHQLQGRRDKEIGPWSLKYRVSPIYVSSLDLAIDFLDKNEEALDYYSNELLVVDGEITEFDNKKIVVSYIDENDKYNLDVICYLEDEININELSANATIKVMGKMTKYEKKNKQIIYMQHCFIEEQ